MSESSSDKILIQAIFKFHTSLSVSFLKTYTISVAKFQDGCHSNKYFCPQTVCYKCFNPSALKCPPDRSYEGMNVLDSNLRPNLSYHRMAYKHHCFRLYLSFCVQFKYLLDSFCNIYWNNKYTMYVFTSKPLEKSLKEIIILHLLTIIVAKHQCCQPKYLLNCLLIVYISQYSPFISSPETTRHWL